MDTKKAILVYQYSERIKSELIIASGLVSTMETLDGKELNGAEKLMKSFLEALVIIDNIELHEYTEINRCISAALSLITTSCQRAMEVLIKEHLI
jgi:hypothetical protein